MTFILKNKLEKHIFFIKLQQFFSDLGIRFVPLFEWEFRFERHDLGTEKEGIYFKKLEYEKKKKTFGIQVTFILEIKLQKYIF